MSRIYHSREDRISDLHEDKERVQYDTEDGKRIEDVAEVFAEYSDDLDATLSEYLDELKSDIDEDSDRRMQYARQMVVEKWALAQGALSKVAWVLRVDGNAAYERAIEALKTGAAVDMRGL